MITITEKAKNHLIKLRQKAGLDDTHFVRVAVQGGGCSGLSYKLDFDNELIEKDQVFDYNEIKLVCNLKSYLYLAGTELDYSDGLNGRGFHFANPNASRSCGCGESFAV